MKESALADNVQRPIQLAVDGGDALRRAFSTPTPTQVT
jgi:hypothetical protein